MMFISLSEQTYKELERLRKEGETPEDVIRRLMKEKDIAEKYIYRPDDWEEYQKEKEASG